MRLFLMVFALVAFVSSSAHAWSFYKDSWSGSSDKMLYIQCNNGDKWTLGQRFSDGWVRVAEGNNSYLYSTVEKAAASACKE